MAEMPNIEWNQIPRSAEVIDLGASYVAVIDGVRHGVYWSGQSAATAQAELRRRAKKSKK